MIYVDYVYAQVFEVSFGYFVVHQYDDLFLCGALHGHVKMEFKFAAIPIDYFLDLIDLLVWEMQECFLIFKVSIAMFEDKFDLDEEETCV